MARDLDGYMLPDYPDGPARRHTKWHPGGFELEHRALGEIECRCPCRIAHPHHLVDDCENTARRVGAVAIETIGMSQYILPLCAVCAAAQLHGRWNDAMQQRDGWRRACTGIGQFAVLVGIIGCLVGVPFGYTLAGLWLGAGVGIAGAYAAFVRWRYEQKASR
ncbi:hypothetical protein ACPCAC_24070 [Streptomyces lavendulocolor]|uniref:hypothetical protein n=1 Tax=Streptomyces lavendulocolor TaxID=67316 RepID=UPI003C2D36BA